MCSSLQSRKGSGDSVQQREKQGTSGSGVFLKRNQNIGIRKPEALSASRAAGFNPTVVETWFQQYRETVDRLGLRNVPDHIWNCNETGLQDHFLSSKVVAEVGSLCFEITAGEKGETSTLLACINAAGGYGPNMVIFKGKRMKANWLYGVPENTYLRMSDNGWINAELFTEWGHCFLKSLPKDDPQPHLLLVDGHSSHVYNIDFLNLMKDNNVYVFSLPPHTTHYLQPADRALFKSLKHFWRLEGRRVTRESAGKQLDRALFMPLFSKAWSTATPENAQAGFRGKMMMTPSRLFQATLLATLSMMLSSLKSLCHSLLHSLTPPPLAQEVEVVTEPDLSFMSLVTLPVRERPPSPPSYDRTSQEHFNFVKEKK
ncbi:hypothetical protein ACEWY4_007764 [Coilia grayii]|uniref:DDE-1 domain-containing protein n=1 Tax=Coilia grayii TaxID=363190 RepID=A0ABD1K955_9TELE